MLLDSRRGMLMRTISQLKKSIKITIAPTYRRGEKNRNLDESLLVYNLLISSKNPSDVLVVDVGAAHGSASSRFIRAGARAILIEPHPIRAQKLSSEFKGNQNVSVLQLGISNDHEGEMTLYDSDVSWGISSIKNWHESHFPAHKIQVKRLSDIHLPKKISFLKIDTEGHDLSVIESLNWKEHQVEVVMAEYDDNKVDKSQRGSWKPIVRKLESLGYYCVISEWVPIIRYGANHQWRKIHTKSTSQPKFGSWGNVIAFSKRPKRSALGNALEKSFV